MWRKENSAANQPAVRGGFVLAKERTKEREGESERKK